MFRFPFYPQPTFPFFPRPLALFVPLVLPLSHPPLCTFPAFSYNRKSAALYAHLSSLLFPLINSPLSFHATPAPINLFQHRLALTTWQLPIVFYLTAVFADPLTPQVFLFDSALPQDDIFFRGCCATPPLTLSPVSTFFSLSPGRTWKDKNTAPTNSSISHPEAPSLTVYST